MRAASLAAFMERGCAGASTLAIATRAKVSKWELYALFEDKRAMLAACIESRARRMRQPLELPTPDDRAGLSATLAHFGAVLMCEVCQPGVTAAYRLPRPSGDAGDPGALSGSRGFAPLSGCRGRWAGPRFRLICRFQAQQFRLEHSPAALPAAILLSGSSPSDSRRRCRNDIQTLT